MSIAHTVQEQLRRHVVGDSIDVLEMYALPLMQPVIQKKDTVDELYLVKAVVDGTARYFLQKPDGRFFARRYEKARILADIGECIYSAPYAHIEYAAFGGVQ